MERHDAADSARPGGWLDSGGVAFWCQHVMPPDAVQAARPYAVPWLWLSPGACRRAAMVLQPHLHASHAQDPSGAYVRRWVPELAKLSPQYIHCPWTAPSAVLEAAGVQLGVEAPCTHHRCSHGRVWAGRAPMRSALRAAGNGRAATGRTVMLPPLAPGKHTAPTRTKNPAAYRTRPLLVRQPCWTPCSVPCSGTSICTPSASPAGDSDLGDLRVRGVRAVRAARRLRIAEWADERTRLVVAPQVGRAWWNGGGASSSMRALSWVGGRGGIWPLAPAAICRQRVAQRAERGPDAAQA